MHYLCFICMTNHTPLWLVTAEQRQILEALLCPDVDLTLVRNIDLWRCEDCGRLIEVVQGFRKTCLVGAKFLLSSIPKGVRANTKSSKSISTAPSILSTQEQDGAISSDGAVPRLQPLYRTSTGLSISAVLSYNDGPTYPTKQSDDPLHIEFKKESQENSPLEFRSYSDTNSPSIEKSEFKDKPPDESPVENELSLTDELNIKFEPASDSDAHEAEARDSESTDTCESDYESQIPMAPVNKVIVNMQPGAVKKTTSKPVITIKKSNIVSPTSFLCSQTMSVDSNLKKPDVQKEKTNVVDTKTPVITIKKSNIVSPTSLQSYQTMSVDSNLKKPDVQKEKTNVVDTKTMEEDPRAPWYIRVLSAEELAKTREEARRDPKFAQAQFKCESCIEVFDCQRGADIHAMLHQPARYVCPICSQSLNSARHLEDHTRQHATQYCCCFCPYATADIDAIEQHRCTTQHHWGRTNFVKTLFEKPKSQEPRRFKCVVCASRFRTDTAFKKHMERKHKEPAEPKTCNVCNKVFEYEYKYRTHYTVCHKIPESRTIDNFRPELFCAECSMQFNSPSQYNIHKTSLKHMSRDQRPFECDSCDRRFPMKSLLDKHRNYVHLKQVIEKKHQCADCPKFYTTAGALRRHVQTAHEARPKQRPHVCHLCGGTFTVKKSLTEHLLKHEGVRPHRCPLCPATFTFRAALYTHNKLKHLRVKRNEKKKKKKKDKDGRSGC